MKSVVIIITYFGKWPQGLPLFLASCAANSTITWHIHTDCGAPDYNAPPNVVFFHTSFEKYKRRVRDALGVPYDPNSTYKLCDLKPTLGVVHEDEIASCDYLGWGDVDLVYGNIRKFYDDHVLSHNVISTHGWMTSGHLTLIKNEPWLLNAFRRIPRWQQYLCNKRILPWRLHLAEPLLTRVVSYPWPWWPRRTWLARKCRPWSIWCRVLDWGDPGGRRYRCHNYFKEQYTTPFTPEP